MRSPMKNTVLRRCVSSRSAVAMLVSASSAADAALATSPFLALSALDRSECRAVDRAFQPGFIGGEVLRGP